LCRLRQAGVRSVTVLDAGCGPGTWLRRLVTRAVELRFATINARGFDVAEAQIETARRAGGDLARLPGVSLKFDVADLTSPLNEADGSVDLTLCLYSVLSHLPVASLPCVASEIARVTRGHFITTVRAAGSMPTIFIDSIDKARNFRLDHSQDRYHIELRNGRCIDLRSHLYTACELRKAFGRHFEVEELSGLDIFHSRFLPDRRWNPASVRGDKQFLDLLAQLEEVYAADARFIERATHLLFVGRRRGSSAVVGGAERRLPKEDSSPPAN
jgi:SAM-dependent methyltransferase